jgi:predicted histone-like DNA-binding protein
LTKTDVSAVLDALSHVMGEDLAEGRQVHLDGIGYFHPVLTSTEPVTAATKRKTTKIKLKGIKFRADQVLKNEIGAIKAKPLGLNEHSQKLSDKEIDRRLTSYFSTHQFLTRSDFQSLCGMMRSTAQLHIRLLRSEGKLENTGKLNQPIYVPCTGYYGRDE